MNGLNTLMNQNDYFIREEIPRFLSRKVDENYELWFLGNDMEKNVLIKKLPECLSNNIVYYNSEYPLDILDDSDKDDSLILVSNKKDRETFKLAGFKKVFISEKYFDTVAFPRTPIDAVDYLFCFGFDDVEFVEFCKFNKSRGFLNGYIVFDLEEPLTLSYQVDRNLNYSENYNIFNNFVNKQVSEGKYKIKNNTHVMAVLYQGKEEDKVSETKLPVLYY